MIASCWMKIDRHYTVTPQDMNSLFQNEHLPLGLLSFEPILAWSMCERVSPCHFWKAFERLEAPTKMGQGNWKYIFPTPTLMYREYFLVVLMSFGTFCTYRPLEKWSPSLDTGFKMFNRHLAVGERSQTILVYMDISTNSGTPKWMAYNEKPY